MKEQNQNQNRSLEMKNYKNILDNNSTSSPFSSKSKNNIYPENNKENLDSNKPYLISDNSQSAINPLSKSHENLNTSNNLINTNNLFIAVEYNDIERVNELLKQDNSKINELNEEGLSLLHIAVIKANIKMVNLLLSYGADSNICSDKKKQTPLHLAYLNQNSMTEEIIKELLKYKADDNICDTRNKKPSDYICSSYKKNKHKKFNIYPNNENSNNEYNNSAEKKSYINNNTVNTVTVVTIDNHLDSFLTTNKEDENKSNQNNINTNSNNNTIIQTPTKLDVDYDFNEIISINNSVEKSNNQINNNNLKINNEEGNKNIKKASNRRQYTFGKEDDYFKFQNKNSDISINMNNMSNNNNFNSNLDNIDINNNYYFENMKKENNKKSEEEKTNLNVNLNKEDLDKTPRENEILNDSLEEENNINEKNDENEREEEDEKEEEGDNNDELYDSLKNKNLLNKDNNIQNSFNLNNNSLTYTESINVNGSCFQSKNKISQTKIPNGSNNNTNENEDNNGNDIDEEIILKSPYNDNNLDIDSIQQNNEEINDNINDILLKNIIKKKRNSFKKINKLGNTSRTSINSVNNNIVNRNFRLSAYNNSALNLGENDFFNNSLRSNRTNRTNYLSPLGMHNKVMSENKNNLKYLNKQKKRDSYNNLINHNNTYKNSNTIIHNGNDSRIGFTGDATQYSTQSQNNKRKNLISSKDKIKVIMNNNSIPNTYNNNERITEFNCNDNIININTNNIYNNNDIIDNNLNITYLKYWLNNIGLIDFVKNFTDNNIYDINSLVERMKSYQTKLRYETLESILKIRTPGYLYRILCKLEADAGLIDPKIVKFMIRDGINNDSKNLLTRSNNNENNLNISITQSYYHCYNCCKMNKKKKKKKNDLKYFLLRNDLINLYQNFYHNGFDMIEYVIIQMYSSFPINDDILENYFHIYDEKMRTSALKAIVAEMKIINRFMNSDEYNNNCDKNKVKYDNVIFDENENREKSKIYVKNTTRNEADCILF